MKTIFKRELKESMLTIKSLIVLLFFSMLTYFISKHSPELNQLSGGDSSLTSLIYATIETSGVFFSFLIFSGTIAKMVENGSIRFLISYTSRAKVLIAKYLAMNIYFIILLIIMLPVIGIARGEIFFPILEMAQAVVFFAYITSIVMLLSVITKHERTANFVGIILGFLIPIIGVYSTVVKNRIINLLSWLLPYRYETFNLKSLILIGITIIILCLSVNIFKRLEL